MRALPQTAALIALARRLVWFEPPEQALSDSLRFLAYAFRHARAAEMALLRQHVSDEELREALESAPAGIIDARSWSYWRLMFDLEPAPLPERRFGPHSA